MAAHWASTEQDRDEKQSQKNEETKKALTFAFRGWTTPLSLQVFIRRTVNCGISNKSKPFITAVGYGYAKGEVSVPIVELPILDRRRW